MKCKFLVISSSELAVSASSSGYLKIWSVSGSFSLFFSNFILSHARAENEVEKEGKILSWILEVSDKFTLYWHYLIHLFGFMFVRRPNSVVTPLISTSVYVWVIREFIWNPNILDNIVTSPTFIKYIALHKMFLQVACGSC